MECSAVPKFAPNRKHNEPSMTLFNKNESGQSIKVCMFIIILLLAFLILIAISYYSHRLITKGVSDS